MWGWKDFWKKNISIYLSILSFPLTIRVVNDNYTYDFVPLIIVLYQDQEKMMIQEHGLKAG